MSRRFGDAVPPGPWADPPRQAVVVPIRSNIPHELAGLLVAGISARLKLDELYRSFLDLVATQIATAIANARAYEEERKRAEALADIDRAKTAFFSNVSHQFRTPLTLMLGPLEELINEFGRSDQGLSVPHQIVLVHRSGLRLLKLVNTLLDFSRIEAGRVQAIYEPTDLPSYTAELASVFRSAVEKSEMKLVVDCPAVTEHAFVDRDMWEKIVLNLVSNAFKFTFKGEIEVKLRTTGTHFELAVRDTGIGIPADEVPQLFERFHRVAGAQGRTHEGSGIGLALVQELAKLHGGSVSVESVYGQGSTFSVCIPRGNSHLPATQIGLARTQASTALGAQSFVEEALRWLPDAGVAEDDDFPSIPIATPPTAQGAERARVLIADDNADMRDYVRRLLSSSFLVEAVADGEAALVVIMLSARAGEEAKVEGLAAEVDDYLIKPFSARELLAHVAMNVKAARMRRESTEALRESEKRLSAELAAATRMQQVSTRLVQAGDVSTLLIDVLDAAIDLSSADMGNIQLLEHGVLKIVAHRGFETPFLEFFNSIDQGPAACVTAIEKGERVIVSDVASSEIFAGSPALSVMLAAGARAVQSTPLVSRSGRVLGVLSTHYHAPHRPSHRELRLLDVLARQAADILERRQAEQTQRLLVNELNHRVKNTLASVQAIAQHTLRHTRDPAEFVTSFAGRLQSLSRVHSILSNTTWQGADLGELIRDQLLLGSVDEARLTTWGPAVQLGSQMALHSKRPLMAALFFG
jgi:signal transduction histidine kinase/CheY-like chemotaxis protein